MRNSATAGALLALSLAAAAGGCGNQHGQPPDLSQLGKPGRTAHFEASGHFVGFSYPASWTASHGGLPALAALSSGSAIATVYAYPRRDLATDPAAVAASRKRVIGSLEERAPGFLVQGTSITTVDGAPAVEVRGRGAIAGTVVEVRSVHVYKDKVEWVIDAYATPGKFRAANRIAFAPMLRSIDLANGISQEQQTGAKGEGGNGA